MTFGEKLQRHRKELGWTQEQLAAQINVSRQALSKWELGTAVPDTENVIQISNLFGVSIDYLLRDDCESDEDIPAVRTSRQKLDHRFRDRLRVAAGACLSGVSLLGMLIIGILSSVFPAVYAVSPVGVNWTRVYTGLSGFLKFYHLEWLFSLCILTLLAGMVLLLFPRLKGLLGKWKLAFPVKKSKKCL